MAHPRIRDFVTFLTTLPASMMIIVCLVLPHQQTCNGKIETPFESGRWLAIVPIAIAGALPLAWRVVPRLRRTLPELVLAFTMIAMALVVVTIPVAIWLMWGYAKRSFRGELLVAMCSAALVMIWLVCYPFLTLFTTWLPAAEMTWGAAAVELVGLMVWASAAAVRPVNADEERSLHDERARRRSTFDALMHV